MKKFILTFGQNELLLVLTGFVLTSTILVASKHLHTTKFTPLGVVTIAAPQVQTPPEPPLLDQINAVRAKVGAKTLVEDPKLDVAAGAKLGKVIQANIREHQLPNGELIFKDVLGAYPRNRGMGENLAWCWHSDSETVNAWVASPGHYKNMIGDWQGFGWAEAINPVDHCNYTINEFVKY